MIYKSKHTKGRIYKFTYVIQYTIVYFALYHTALPALLNAIVFFNYSRRMINFAPYFKMSE